MTLIETLLLLSIVFLFYVLANILYTVHEHLKFNYRGSLFEKLDSRLKRPWWCNNARPDLQEDFPFFPMIWDGYHCTGWLMQLCYWMMFALVFNEIIHEPWYIISMGMIMSWLGYLVHQVSYRWFFERY